MKWLVVGTVTWFFFASVLILPAGRWDWLPGYAVPAFTLAGWIWVNRDIQARQPGLFARRGQHAEGTPRWDFSLVFWLRLAVLSILVLAGLDAGRRGISAPAWSLAAGAALYVAGTTLFRASVLTNPFFEGMVRHQVEVGHRVVQEGPYSKLRHPGYLAFLLVFAALPLLLASSWAWAGYCLVLLCFVFRIFREERFLLKHLEEYSAYCSRVRYRLLPGLW